MTINTHGTTSEMSKIDSEREGNKERKKMGGFYFKYPFIEFSDCFVVVVHLFVYAEKLFFSQVEDWHLLQTGGRRKILFALYYIIYIYIFFFLLNKHKLKLVVLQSKEEKKGLSLGDMSNEVKCLYISIQCLKILLK